MSAPNIAELYPQYLIPLILSGVEHLVGMPRTIAIDEKAFHDDAIDPIWNGLPASFRMLGRDKLRWDEFLMAARGDLFRVFDGKLAIRPDATVRLIGLVQRMFGQPTAPVAQPVAPPSKPAPAARQPAPPSRVTDGPAIGIDLGTTYSVVAHVDGHGRPVSVPNSVGDI